MKLLTLLIAASFAAFVAAAPAVDVPNSINWTTSKTDWGHRTRTHSHHSTRSPRLTHLGVATSSADTGDSIKWTTTVTARPTSTDWDLRPTDTTFVFTNTTDPASGSQQEDIVVAVTIRDKRPQSMGQMRGAALYQAIYRELLVLCPEGRGDCLTWDGVPRKPPYIDWWRAIPVHLHSIYHMDGKMAIWVGEGHHRSEQIRKLLIGTVAGTIEAAVESAENQPASYFYNIPNFVGVKTKGGDVLAVTFKALHPTIGNFNCGSITQKAANALRGLFPEWNQVVGPGQGAIWCQP